MITKEQGNTKITYKSDVVPTAQQIIDLYNDAELPRPTRDPERIQTMFENSDLIVTAWDGDKLVGVSQYNYRLGLVQLSRRSRSQSRL